MLLSPALPQRRVLPAAQSAARPSPLKAILSDKTACAKAVPLALEGNGFFHAAAARRPDRPPNFYRDSRSDAAAFSGKTPAPWSRPACVGHAAIESACFEAAYRAAMSKYPVKRKMRPFAAHVARFAGAVNVQSLALNPYAKAASPHSRETAFFMPDEPERSSGQFSKSALKCVASNSPVFSAFRALSPPSNPVLRRRATPPRRSKSHRAGRSTYPRPAPRRS